MDKNFSKVTFLILFKFLHFHLAGSLFDQRRDFSGKYCDESSKGHSWLHDFGNVAIDKENNQTEYTDRVH